MAVINSNRYDVSGAISRILAEFSAQANEAMYEAIDEVGRESVRKLRAVSRESFKGTKYAKGWTSKKDQGRLIHGVTIYNKYPGLPHLLEHGHATRNGTGRVFADTPGRVHIEPVATWAEDEVLDRVVTKLERMSR